jgi:uncharacterized membrane protein YfcA
VEDLVGCYDTHVSTAKLLILIAVFFFTSVLSVVTGSTSLITVPVMIGLGIEAHVAIATNMLALTFMSVGGSLPFMGRGVLSPQPPAALDCSHGHWFWLGCLAVAYCAE